MGALTLNELRSEQGIKPVPRPHDDAVHALGLGTRFMEASYVSVPADMTNPCAEIPLGTHQQCTLGATMPEPPVPEPTHPLRLKPFKVLW